MPLVVQVEDIDSHDVVEYAFTRSPVRIGRNARNDLCLRQQFVSAWHGLVEFDGEGARYTDLGSTNGTLLDGEPLEARSTRRLDGGAEITIGSLRLTFSLRHSTTAAARPLHATEPSAIAPAALGGSELHERSEPLLPPGGITALMKQLAVAPAVELDGAWRKVLVPGAVIGRFEIQREIGRGSFGVVFEAKDRQLGRLVAFKAVRPGRESQVMFREELLQKEAEAIAQLNHPNIVSLYDAGACDSGPYLIMELLRGETLRDRMHRGRLPVADAIEIAVEIAWALDHAHAAGVIHRDLKPANVFVCSSGQVKVLDFGIAHVFGVGASKAVGTPAYMAPEQWRQERQDARTDVFGAAAILAEMVTGRLPYRATKDWSAVLEPDARPSLPAAGVPPALIALLRRALSPTPGNRPKDGHAWLGELLHIHEMLDVTPALGVEREAAPRAARPVVPAARDREAEGAARRKGAFVVGALAAATTLAGLAYLLLS